MTCLALIGCGKWGQNYINCIDKLKGVKLSQICDSGLSCIFDGKDIIGTVVSYKAVRNVDGVIVATPPNTHKEIACHFLSRGAPVLLEKPVAETVEDAELIFKTARKNKTFVLVDNTHLFSPAFVALRKVVKSWKGPLKILSEGGNYGPFRDYSPLLDYGPHDISMCLSIFQSYPHTMSVDRHGDGGNSGYTFNIKLTTGSAEATIELGNGMFRKKRRFEVSDMYNNAVYDDLSADKLVVNGMPYVVSSTSPLDVVVRMFVQHIEHKMSDWRFNPKLNVNVMRIIEQLCSMVPDD